MMTIHKLLRFANVTLEDCPEAFSAFRKNDDQALYDTLSALSAWAETEDGEVAADAKWDRMRFAVGANGESVRFFAFIVDGSLQASVVDSGNYDKGIIDAFLEKRRKDTDGLVRAIVGYLENLVPEGKEIVLNRWASHGATTFDINMPVAFVDNSSSAPYPEFWLVSIYSLRHKDGRLEFSFLAADRRLIYMHVNCGVFSERTVMSIYERIHDMLENATMDGAEFELVDFVGEFAEGSFFSIVPVPTFGGVEEEFGVVSSPIDYLFQKYGLEYNNAFRTRADAEVFFNNHGMKQSQFCIKPYSESENPIFYSLDGKPESEA